MRGDAVEKISRPADHLGKKHPDAIGEHHADRFEQQCAFVFPEIRIERPEVLVHESLIGDSTCSEDPNFETWRSGEQVIGPGGCRIATVRIEPGAWSAQPSGHAAHAIVYQCRSAVILHRCSEHHATTVFPVLRSIAVGIFLPWYPTG